VAAVVADLQRTRPERRARDAHELVALLEDLGDLTQDEVTARVVSDPTALLDEVAREGRATVVALGGGQRAWVVTHDAPLYAALDRTATLERLALRALRTRGPLDPAWFAARYGVAPERVRAILDSLVVRGVLRYGTFRTGAAGPEYIHVAVLEELQRRHVQARRAPRPPVPPERFSALLLRRHHLCPETRLRGPEGVRAALTLLQGLDLPLRLWEHALLPGRVEDYRREWLDHLGLTGEIVWTVFEPVGGRPGGRVGVALREELRRWRDAPPVPPLDPRTKNVWLHLQLRGASFVQDLARVTGLRIPETTAALRELFWAGLVAPDSFSALLAAIGAASARAARRARPGATRGPLTGPGGAPGRWSALAEQEPSSEDERLEARARLLLLRYGVVSRELVEPRWGGVRRALVRLEYAGEAVRGYFVEGLSGEQYALAEVLESLTAAPRRAEPHVLVNLADPANVWGRVFTLSRPDGRRLAPPRIPSSWLVFRGGWPVLLAEGHGRELTPLAGWEPVDFPGAVRALTTMVERPWPLRPVRRLEVRTWDGRPVRTTEAGEALLAAGFWGDGPRLFYDGHPAPESRP
jgi:ATP-dependent Lhr-like helicase